MARWTMRRALLALALLIALSGCGASGKGNSQPPNASVTATATVTLPAGWYTAPTPGGRIFANNSGFRGLVASPANPSEIAGCGLPLPGGDQTAVPVFLWSMDAGHSWRVHAIPGAAPTMFCALVADTMLPGTFVLQTDANWTTRLLLTRDNGARWQSLPMPSGYTTNLAGSPGYVAPALVNGHLIASLLPAGQTSGFRLYDIALAGGSKALDAHLPQPPKTSGLPADTPPEALAVDPADPRHLYVAVYGAFGPNHNSGVTLYMTRDRGATWQTLHEWRTTQSLALWAAPGNNLYAADFQDPQPGVYASLAGSTWQYTALNISGFSVGPSGKVLVFTSQGNAQSLFMFDAATQRLTSLGPVPDAFADSLAVAMIVDHPAPTLVLASGQGTFGLPLNTAS